MPTLHKTDDLFIYIYFFIYLFIYLFIYWLVNWLIDWLIDWLKVSVVQQELLWLLYDLGHLNKYPMALGKTLFAFWGKKAQLPGPDAFRKSEAKV